MKALTLWRPWPWAIFYPIGEQSKPVENRTWPPPRWIIGKQIAIHACKRYDEDSAEDIADFLEMNQLPKESFDQGIIGLAVVDRFISGGILGSKPNRPGDPLFKSHWYCGPYGWSLSDRILLPRPVPCRGAQGLWDIPLDVIEQIAKQVGRSPCKETVEK